LGPFLRYLLCRAGGCGREAARPRFLSDERDAEIMLKGVKLVRRIVQAPALAKYLDKDLFAAGSTSDEALMSHIRDKADTSTYLGCRAKYPNSSIAYRHRIGRPESA
jgi:choline dehydrogenase-like flavoprotein